MTLTVEELNEYVRRSLASDPMLRGVCLRGEISNFKRHVSGHWYFTLKDANSAISCAMFRQSALGVSFAPRDGRQVKLYGSVGLYVKTGQYQFYAEAMEPDGMGEMFALFEERKQRLAKEGLFDPALKKPIPLLPKGIGIVTSKTGAVVHDIARVAWRRNEGMPLYLCPVLVQGQGAAEEIAEGIALLDGLPEVEVIIVGRGGGSMEDLWAFNEEIVARAIAACATPVISAVGHETDFTIADFVADLRAPTPSAAAEMAVQPRQGLLQTIVGLRDRVEHAAEFGVGERQYRLSTLERRIGECDPDKRGQAMLSRLREARQRIEALCEGFLRDKAHAVEQKKIRLRASGPEATLLRGYAIVLRQGKPVPGAAGVCAGDNLDVIMSGGTLGVSVTAVAKEEGFWLTKEKKSLE